MSDDTFTGAPHEDLTSPGGMGVEYFAQEEICAFLPSLLELRILDFMRNRPGMDPVGLHTLASDLGISPVHVDGAIARLSSRLFVIVADRQSSPRVQITSNGRKYVENVHRAEYTNAQTCAAAIADALQVPADQSAAVLKELDAYLAAQQPTAILAFLNADESTVTTLPVNIRSLAKVLTQTRGRAQSGMPPLLVRTLGHLVVAYAVETWNRLTKARPKPLCVYVDTNVLLSLIRRSDRTNVARDTIAAVNREAPVTKFMITEATWAELLGHLDAVEERCNALQMRGTVLRDRRLGKFFREMKADGTTTMAPADYQQRLLKALLVDNSEPLTKEDAESLTPLGEEYFVRADSTPTFRDFRDSKLAELIGLTSLGASEVRWRPDFVDTSQTLNEDVIGEALTRLASGQGGWVLRKKAVEYHDVQLVLFAHRQNELDGDTHHVVWTHHAKLARLCEILGIDASFVLYGPGLRAYTSFGGTETIRDYLRKAFLSGEKDSGLNLLDLQRAIDNIRAHTAEHSASQIVPTLLRVLRAGVQSDVPEASDIWQGEPNVSERYQISAPEGLRVTEPSDLDKLGWISMTMDWGLSPGGHGIAPLGVMWEGDIHQWNSRSMHWSMSPHTVTHIDLPWALEQHLAEFGQDPRAFRDTVEAQRFFNRTVEPRSLRAVFIDFTQMQSHLGLRDSRGLLRDMFDWTPNRLVEVTMASRIDRAALVARIPETVDLNDRLVVIHTGWASTFSNLQTDLSSLLWEGAHPWLVHPWLDGSAAAYLTTRGSLGLAIDAPMADNPMCIADHVSPSRTAISEACAILFGNGPTGKGLPRKQETHIEFLTKFRLLVESLCIPETVMQWYGASGHCVETEVFMTTLHFHLLPDAAPIVFMARDPIRAPMGVKQ